MAKREALKILITHNFLLAADERQKLLDKVDTMSDEEVENLGKFLALEKKHSLQQVQSRIDSIRD